MIAAVLGAEQVLTSRAAAASDAGESGGWGAAIGVEEGSGRGGGAVIGREVIGEDGRLYVAQEHRIVVEVIEGCVCHGEDAVAFTWRKNAISLGVRNLEKSERNRAEKKG